MAKRTEVLWMAWGKYGACPWLWSETRNGLKARIGGSSVPLSIRETRLTTVERKKRKAKQ